MWRKVTLRCFCPLVKGGVWLWVWGVGPEEVGGDTGPATTQAPSPMAASPQSGLPRNPPSPGLRHPPQPAQQRSWPPFAAWTTNFSESFSPTRGGPGRPQGSGVRPRRPSAGQRAQERPVGLLHHFKEQRGMIVRKRKYKYSLNI